ncbi:hypothetical protein [Flaviflexus huanghaiensis]|uniref:hypothetical protein n=1 Tax=Flaviflexus huanghaiensis TaxID=1111473 RepID=UPI0015FCCFE2|nr:hypothetical protein [Flaviflexus huanghaiensis]
MSENTDGRRPGDEGRDFEQSGGTAPREDATQAYPPQAGQYPPAHQAGQPYPYGSDSGPQHGQPGYGQPADGQTDHGQPAYGSPQYPQQGYGPEGYPPTAAYPPGGGGGGYPPQGGYGQPPKKKGPLIAWIVLAVLLLVAIVVGILFATGVLGGDDEPTPGAEETLVLEPTEDATEEATEEATTREPTVQEPSSYGDDAELDALWDACEEGDMEACDELWYSSGFDTEYEEFGATCGGTQEYSPGMCNFDPDSEMTGGAYGDDPALDELWDACEAGDFEACDELWWDSPIDSDYEAFAETCGGRTEGSLADCVIRAENGEIQP